MERFLRNVMQFSAIRIKTKNHLSTSLFPLTAPHLPLPKPYPLQATRHKLQAYKECPAGHSFLFALSQQLSVWVFLCFGVGNACYRQPVAPMHQQNAQVAEAHHRKVLEHHAGHAR